MDDLGERRPIRFRRYSLKTAFILLTALCLLLGWMFREIHRQHRQDATIQSLSPSGYRFYLERLESKNAFSAATWLDFLDERYLDQVVSISAVFIEPPRVHHLRDLAQFKHLARLSLTNKHLVNSDLLSRDSSQSGFELSPESLHAICDLARLEYLTLNGVDLPKGHAAEFTRLKHLARLHITASNIGDGDLAAIHQNQNLTSLILAKCGLSDAGIKPLARLNHLTQLDLSRTKITDAAFVELAKLHQLKFLNVSETNVTDAGLAELATLVGLEQLDVQNTAVTDEGVTSLQTRLPKLAMQTTETRFRGTPSIRNRRANNEQLKQQVVMELSGPFVTDHSLAWLRPAARLKSLDLMESRITDAGIQHLSALKTLTSVDIRETAVTDQGLDALIELPLQSLLVGDQITDAGVEKISRIKSLKFLALSGPAISDDGLRQLANLTSLQSCWLTVPTVRGPGFEFVTALPRLESLTLYEPVLTEEIAGHLGRAPALNHLELGGNIDNKSLAALAPAANMKILSLSSIQIDSSAVPTIAAMPSLESVLFGHCPKLTVEDGKRLLAMRPKLQIWMNGKPVHVK